jgi:hypothetical protein
VIRTLRALQAEGSHSVPATVADMLSVSETQVRAAVASYADHGSELDQRIAAYERVAAELESAWRRQQEILAGSAT